MRLKLQAVRMYGSKSRYGEEQQVDPIGQPLVVSSYPTANDQTVLHLGAPPEWVLTANRLRRAFGYVGLQMMSGQVRDPQTDLQTLLERALVKDTFVAGVAEYGWCITIIVEREIDLPEERIDDNRPFWLDIGAAQELDNEFHTFVRPHIDLLVAYASATFQPIYWEKRLIDDVVFFSAEGRGTLGLPRFSASASASLTASLESLHTTRLKKHLRSAQQVKDSKLSRVIRIADRRLRYARERERPKDRIVDLMIGAEALFLHGIEPSGAQEMISFRLALRASLFLETDPEAQKAMRDHWRTAYEVRNAIVHGEMRELQKALGGASLEGFAQATEQYLHRALDKFIEREPPFPLVHEDELVYK